MKTEHILIDVPAEGPQIPQGWKFTGYAVYNGTREAWPSGSGSDPMSLKQADYWFAMLGAENHTIIAQCENCNADGCYSIYSEFGLSFVARVHSSGDLYEWGTWLDTGDCQPFDFLALNKVECKKCNKVVRPDQARSLDFSGTWVCAQCDDQRDLM